MKKLIIFALILSFAYLANAQEVHHSPNQIAVRAGIYMPQGDNRLSNNFDSGLGFEGMYEYFFKKKIGLFGKVGYKFWEPINENSYEEIVFSAIPIVVGINYYLTTDGYKFYVSLEGGPNLTRYKIRYKETGIEETTNDTNFGISPGVGLAMPFGAIDFGVEGRYGIIMQETDNLNNLVINFFVSYRL